VIVQSAFSVRPVAVFKLGLEEQLVGVLPEFVGVTVVIATFFPKT